MHLSRRELPGSRRPVRRRVPRAAAPAPGKAMPPGQSAGVDPQITIPYIETMPNIRRRSGFGTGPAWRRVGRLSVRPESKGAIPSAELDKQKPVNFNADTFGLDIAVGDPLCSPRAGNGDYHLAICDMPAVIGASLVGIDKSRQGGHDWANMEKAFFGRANGNDVFLGTTHDDRAHNKDGDIEFRDFWSDAARACSALNWSTCTLGRLSWLR